MGTQYGETHTLTDATSLKRALTFTRPSKLRILYSKKFNCCCFDSRNTLEVGLGASSRGLLRWPMMDSGYLTTQVSTIIGQLHGLFDEIGVPSHERESRESEVRGGIHGS